GRGQVLEEGLQLFLDEGHAADDLALAVDDVLGHDLLEVVDVVEVDVVDVVHQRVDVAGQGDVDEEHRVVAPRREGRLDGLDAQDVAVAADAADDDVAEGQDAGE